MNNRKPAKPVAYVNVGNLAAHNDGANAEYSSFSFLKHIACEITDPEINKED